MRGACVKCFPLIDIICSSRDYASVLNSSRRDVWPVKAALPSRIRRSIQVIPFRFEAALLIGHARLVPSKYRAEFGCGAGEIVGIHGTGPCGAAAAEQLVGQGGGVLGAAASGWRRIVRRPWRVRRLQPLRDQPRQFARGRAVGHDRSGRQRKGRRQSVGCKIVDHPRAVAERHGRIIGEGSHAGPAHADVGRSEVQSRQQLIGLGDDAVGFLARSRTPDPGRPRRRSRSDRNSDTASTECNRAAHRGY